MITELESPNPNDDLYILGDFNINFLFNDKCILNKSTETKKLYKAFSSEIEKTQ